MSGSLGWRRDRSKRAALFASAVCIVFLWPHPARALPRLPTPVGDPRSIDLAADPILAFGRDTVAPQLFLDRLGEAVGHHPAVAAAIAEAQAKQGVRTQVRSGLFPQLDVSLVASRQLARDFGSRDTIVESLQPRGRTDLNVNGDQLLFDFGATSKRIAAADARVAAAQAEVEQVASDTGLDAVSAYYDVLAAQALSAVEADAVARQRAVLGQIEARVDAGLGAGGDVARGEAMLAETQATSANLERQLGQARARYREAFGDDPPAVLSRPLAPSSAAPSLDAAQALARHTPAVTAAVARATAARRDWRAVHADGLPRLSAGVSGIRYSVFSGSDYEVRGQVTLSQSLFAGGRQRGAVDEAAARSQGAAATADQIVDQAERDAGAAFTDVAASVSTVETLRAAYIANRRVRDAYVEQFRMSRGTLIELLRAEQDFQRSASALLRGVIDLDKARYVLLARTGEILPAIGLRFDALTSQGQ